MGMFKRLFVYAALIFVLACTTKQIPGTDLKDTESNRALLEMLDDYRRAVEDKNVEGIVRLLDESFSDDGGTADMSDDMEYANARQKLEERFSRANNIRLQMNFRKMERSKSQPDVYLVSYNYRLSFSMGDKNMQDSDVKQMHVRKNKDGSWRILSGI
jgi:ketosteroid isomerase-like protein